MLEPKFPLNGPQAVVFASMYGSHEILKFVLEQVDTLQLRLELEVSMVVVDTCWLSVLNPTLLCFPWCH